MPEIARPSAATPVQGPYEPLLTAVGRRLDRDVYAFTRLCVYNAATEAPIGALTNACGVHRRTLEEKLRRFGYPTPLDILTSTTVAIGTWFYDVGQLTLKAVAQQLELGSAAHLSLLCQRRFELTPTEIRAIGWQRVMLPLWAWQFRIVPPRELLAV
jgi:AraC-like DNA-binding protein